MGEQGSVTVWLGRLKDGDLGEPVRRLWEGYYARLVGLSRGRLAARVRAVTDGDDVALSAFDSFVRSAAAGRFPRLDDRDDLWRILFVVTVRKAADAAARESRARRGGGRVVSLSPVTDGSTGPEPEAAGPSPEEAAAVADELAHLLGLLADELERRVAVLRLEGYSNAEIAGRIGRSVKTVERKLGLIRAAWRGDPADR